MATIVAAAGGGNWTTGATWVGGTAPTAADDAQLDGTSGAVTVDSGGAVCRSLNCTGYANTLTHNSASTLTIGDATAGASNIALKFVAGMTYTLGSVTTSAISFVTTSATVQTVDFASKTTGNVTYNATSNGSWQMTGTHNTDTTATVTLTKGALDVNAQTCSWGLFSSSNSNVRSLTFGAAAITMTGVGTVWDMGSSSNMTLSAASSTITCNGAGVTVNGGASKTYGTLNLTGSGTATIGSTGVIFAALNRTGTATRTNILTINGAKTVTGTLTLAGESVLNRLLVQSTTVGSAVTITNSGATMALSNVDFMDITLGTSYDASAITGKSGDAGGNSGITFTTAATQTWSGASGGNWADNAWTSRVPLPQDDVVVNAAFSASQTVTADMPRLGKSIDWTGVTGSPTWAFTSTANSIYGSLTMVTGITLSGTNSVTFRGRSNYTITSAGRVFTGTSGGTAIAINAPGGTYTLQDTFSSASNGSIVVTSGTFDANNVAVTCVSLSSTGTLTRAVTMGSGIWTMTRVSASPVLTLAATGLTFSGASATVVVSAATANARTFDGAGFTFGTLTYSVAGSTGTLTITGANTFDTINFSDSSNARTLTLPASSTTTVTTFNVQGTTGKLMTINSSTGGTAATLSKSSGTVSCDYLSIQDSTATGGAVWYAGANSTNVSGNTGWSFTAAPSTGGPNLLMMGVG